jgi:hypothetical protein
VDGVVLGNANHDMVLNAVMKIGHLPYILLNIYPMEQFPVPIHWSVVRFSYSCCWIPSAISQRVALCINSNK